MRRGTIPNSGRLRPLPPSPDSFLARNPPTSKPVPPKKQKQRARPAMWPPDRRRFTPVPPEQSVPRNLASLNLYRRLVRAVLRFPVERLRAKIRFNVSEAFQLQRMEQDPARLKELHGHAETALRLLGAMSALDTPTLELLFSRALNVDHHFHAPAPGPAAPAPK